jgi:23S rRNA-/tRNA-specific pseudouridylate synthase
VVNDKIYGKNDQFFIDYIDKDVQNNKDIPRHSLHSSKLSFIFSSENISLQVGLPEDLAEVWNASAPVGRKIPG